LSKRRITNSTWILKAAWCALVALAMSGMGCSKGPAPEATLTLATTTSTRDSGLLDLLVPMFNQETGIEVKVVAVGTGQALELGRRGDADVLLTHAAAAEEEFMAEGHGQQRDAVMHNDFVLVGPRADPAAVRGLISIAEGLRRIEAARQPFVSRGDNSGTHMKERSLWQEAALEPSGAWYVQAGAGMAAALRIASEKEAYVLSDRGTFLAHRDRLDSAMLSIEDPLLRNPYTATVVSSEKHPGVNAAGARRFSEFLRSPQVQRMIGEFGVETFGQPLFFPDALAGPTGS
jgi:tungstate transport system substrate-binding protein